MRWLMKVLRAVDAINDWIGKMISFLPVPLVIVMAYEVIARYVFGSPTSWAFDVGVIIFAIYVAMTGAYGLLHGAHVNVDIFYAYWSPRRRAIMDIITFIFILGFCTAILWKGYQLMALSIKTWETFSTSSVGVPLYPIKIALMVGTLLLFLQSLAKLARDVVTAITGRRLEPGGVV